MQLAWLFKILLMGMWNSITESAKFIDLQLVLWKMYFYWWLQELIKLFFYFCFILCIYIQKVVYSSNILLLFFSVSTNTEIRYDYLLVLLKMPPYLCHTQWHFQQLHWLQQTWKYQSLLKAFSSYERRGKCFSQHDISASQQGGNGTAFFYKQFVSERWLKALPGTLKRLRMVGSSKSEALCLSRRWSVASEVLRAGELDRLKPQHTEHPLTSWTDMQPGNPSHKSTIP